MDDAIWVGPVVAGLVFGVGFGLLFPIVSRWMAPKDNPPQFSGRSQFLTGLFSGVLFGCLLYVDKLIETGSVGPAWQWFDWGARVFGGLCILGGLGMIVMRLVRGRG